MAPRIMRRDEEVKPAVSYHVPDLVRHRVDDLRGQLTNMDLFLSIRRHRDLHTMRAERSITAAAFRKSFNKGVWHYIVERQVYKSNSGVHQQIRADITSTPSIFAHVCFIISSTPAAVKLHKPRYHARAPPSLWAKQGPAELEVTSATEQIRLAAHCTSRRVSGHEGV